MLGILRLLAPLVLALHTLVPLRFFLSLSRSLPSPQPLLSKRQ
jgi:hypothetical protein